MKKYMALILLALPIIAFAEDKFNNVRIVTLEQMNIPESEKRKCAERVRKEKELGYTESDSDFPKRLRNMHLVARKQIAEREARGRNLRNDPDNPSDTGWYSSTKDFKLAFKHNGINRKYKYVMGYAPVGMYTANGWTGFTVVFSDPKLENCTYTVNDNSLTGGYMQIRDGDVHYDVNDRPNLYYVEGNREYGFMAYLNWFEGSYDKELVCEQPLSHVSIKPRMVEIAKTIDAK